MSMLLSKCDVTFFYFKSLYLAQHFFFKFFLYKKKNFFFEKSYFGQNLFKHLTYDKKFLCEFRV